jgi:hypothetical protein
MMKVFALISCILLMLSASPLHGADQTADCLIDQGPCVKTVGNREVIFSIEPKPVKTMREITFVVHIVGRNIAPTLLLDLSMPGMYMGRNEVVLKKRPDGKYSGKGVIPRCPSGKRLWQAEIDIPGTGKVSYRFNVTS